MLRFVSLLCFALLVAASTLTAQTKKLDSLQTLLKTAKEDTAKVRLLNEVAREQRGDLALQRATAESAYALAMRLGDKSGAARAKNQIASSYSVQSSYAEALRAAEEALALSHAAGDKRQEASAYNRMGTVQWRQGNYDAALDLFFKSLALAEETGDKVGLASTLNNLGNVYVAMGNHASALEYHRKSLALYEELGDKRGATLPINNIGDAYMQQGKHDSALVYFRRGLVIDTELKDKLGLAIDLLNIGESSLRLGRLSDAQPALEEAQKLCVELDLKNFIAAGLQLSSQISAARGNYAEAVRYGIQAVALADSIGARPDKRDAMKALSEAYAGKGEGLKALGIYKDYIALRDSLVNDENTKKAAYREAKYAADKKDKEILLLKKDAENQALVRNSMAGGLTLVGALVGVLVFSNNRRKHANTLLQSQAAEIQLANTQLQEKNIVITEAHERTQFLLTNVNDSIRYAKRIQDAMLPSTETLNRLLPEHFIFFRPKDVVSGDFYWCKEVKGKVFVAAVDCTGHGVPGAFMSLIGNSLLNDITQRLHEPHPDLILNELHHEIQTALRQKETNNKDGMDICLCMIDMQTRIVEFAGAQNPLFAVVAGELREFKGTPEELGGFEERSPIYERHVLDLSTVPQGATMLYLTSDGYKDQYNEVRQRFMPKRLRPLFTKIAAEPLEEQPTLLGEAIDAHKGEMFQVDDMLVLGVRM
jgi:serine phosphatase RsbU (regulator of sigma subunit)